MEPALWRSPATASCPDTSMKISTSASLRLATQAAQGAMVLDTEDNGEGKKKGRREDATTQYCENPSLQPVTDIAMGAEEVSGVSRPVAGYSTA